jgi:hypothetical protein
MREEELKSSKMQFKIPCVFNFLKKNGFVFSVRGYDMKDRCINVEKIGKCWRKKIDRIYKKQDLINFVVFSGFSKMEEIFLWKEDISKELNEWWQTIEKFCKRKQKFLYLVVRLE